MVKAVRPARCNRASMKLAAVGQWIFNLFVFALLGGTVVGMFWLIGKALEKGATVLAASLAAFATVAAAFIVRWFERRKELEATRRQQLGPLFEHLGAVLAGHEATDRKREKILTDYIRKSLMYASPAVLKAWREWRDNLTDDDAPRHEQRANALRYETFVKAMRKDLGVSNWMLSDGDLGRAAIRDWDEYYGDGTPDDLLPPEPDDEPVVSKATPAGHRGH